MKGCAQQVLGEANGNFSYGELVQLLEARFGSIARADVYLAELRGRSRKSGESLPQLGQAIRRLTTLAYPDMDSIAQDRLAKNHFTEALVDQRLRLAIFQTNPPTLDDAIRAAIEMESYYKAENLRLKGKNSIVRGLGTDSSDSGASSNIHVDDLKAQITQLQEELNKYKNQGRRSRFSKDVTCYKCGQNRNR